MPNRGEDLVTKTGLWKGWGGGGVFFGGKFYTFPM